MGQCFIIVMLLIVGVDKKLFAVVEKDIKLVDTVTEKYKDELTLIRADLNQQMREIYYQQKKISGLESDIKSLQAINSDLRSDRAKDQLAISDLQTKLNNMEKLMQQLKPNSGGVSYVRWGKTTCPHSSTMLYKGHVGGTLHSEKGGGSNYLCLPGNPEWGNRMEGFQYEAKMHGAEYESMQFEGIFSKVNNGGRSLQDLDALCVVCIVSPRSAQIMIPARRSCPAGWTMEYRGYLVTQHPNHNNKDFVCLDDEPEGMPGSKQNLNGALFYAVEGVCGSLPCPPYVDGWELTCVVCSK